MNLIKINCKEIFKTAYQNRYYWTDNFNGYKGRCKYSTNKEYHEGSFVIGKDFKPKIKDIDNSITVKSISSQLFEVSIHRVKREFGDIHSKNNFNLIKNTKEGVEMIVSGKNEGDKYRVKNNCINKVYRKIHGFIIEIFVQEFFDTGTGILSKKYTSQQLDPNTLEAYSPKLDYEDNFIKVGQNNIWLLHSRFIKYQNQNNDLETLKYVFEDLTLLN